MSLTDPPQRIFRREWRWNKPHLPKSTSLPEMQLTPKHRPLFTCDQCGFTNTFIPLCLWCCWTSPEANLAFEQSTPRARRISAPPKVSWNVNIRIHSEDNRVLKDKSTARREGRHNRHQPVQIGKTSFTSEDHKTLIRDKPSTSTSTRGKPTKAQRSLRPQLSLNTLVHSSTPMLRQKHSSECATGTPISPDSNRAPGFASINETSMSPDHETRRDDSNYRVENNNKNPQLDLRSGKRNTDNDNKRTHKRSRSSATTVLSTFSAAAGSPSEDNNVKVVTETISTHDSKSAQSSTWAGGSSPTRSLRRPHRPLPLSFVNPSHHLSSSSVERFESISLKKSSSTIGRKKSNNTIHLKHSSSNSTMNALKLSTKRSRAFQSARLILDFSSSTPSSPVDDHYDEKRKHREFEFAPSSLPQEKILAFSPLREKGSSTPPPDRTLRRKKHVSIFRSSAPTPSAPTPIAIELTMHSPPRRQSSHSDTKAVMNDSSTPPQTPEAGEFGTIFSDSRPQSPSSPSRLGSPTRPYYTAIRKNMPSASPPSRPNSITLPSRPISYPPPRPFSALSSSPSSPPLSALSSVPDTEIYPLPACSTSPPRGFGFGAGGCSVSGETELRMALGEVRYKDRRGDGGLVGRVKKLRRGLKEMLAARRG